MSKKIKSLIVEDDPFTQKILCAQMRSFGSCDRANNGSQGVEMFRQSLESPQERYDLVCLDLGLPDMEGMTALNNLRNVESQFEDDIPKRTSMIITTAETKPEIIAKAFEVGCDGYLMKPCTIEEIERELKKLGLLS